MPGMSAMQRGALAPMCERRIHAVECDRHAASEPNVQAP